MSPGFFLDCHAQRSQNTSISYNEYQDTMIRSSQTQNRGGGHLDQFVFLCPIQRTDPSYLVHLNDTSLTRTPSSAL